MEINQVLPQQFIYFVDLGPIFLVQLVHAVIILYAFCCSIAKNVRCNAKWHKITRTILPILKKGDSDTDTRLFKYKVPPSYIFILPFYTAYVTLTAIAVFWQELFVQVYVYQPGLENEAFCYHLGDIWNANCSVVNCTNALCYKFEVNFGKAFTNAAGLFVFFTSILTITTTTLLLVSDGKTGSTWRRCCAKLLHIMIVLLCFILFCILLYVSMLNLIEFKSYFGNIQYILVLFDILSSAIYVPWWEFEKVPHEQLPLEEPDDSLTQPLIPPENEEECDEHNIAE